MSNIGLTSSALAARGTDGCIGGRSDRLGSMVSLASNEPRSSGMVRDPSLDVLTLELADSKLDGAAK